jgi:hypothetical protein
MTETFSKADDLKFFFLIWYFAKVFHCMSPSFLRSFCRCSKIVVLHHDNFFSFSFSFVFAALIV